MRILPILVMWVVACGGDPPNVGGTCTATDEACDEGLTCDTAVPGGYCTTSCTMSGSTSECPEASVCDTISGDAVTCVKICKSSADCRSDQDCNGVSGSNIKACKPKS